MFRRCMLLTGFMLGTVVFMYPACVSAMYKLPAFNVPLVYLLSMIASTLTDACICKLHLYILAGCGKQQTRNDRFFIAVRIVCHCLLKTFDANFPVWHGPLSKVYFPKCTFESYFRKKTFQCVMTFSLMQRFLHLLADKLSSVTVLLL